MKRVYILFSIVCGFALMAQSCHTRVDLNDEPIVGDGDIALSVTTSIDGGAVDSRAVSTTATKSSFADDDRFSFYLSLSVNNLNLGSNMMRGSEYSNIQYTVTGGKAAPAGTTDVPADVIYYPYRTADVNLWGIYPYDADMKSKDTKVYEWSVFQNQSTKANLLNSDLLVAKSADVTPTEGTPIAMSFAHKMSRIELKLSIPLEVDGKTVATGPITGPIAFIYFEGMKLDGSYNFIDDETTVSTSAEVVSITPLSMGSELVNSTVPSEGNAHSYEAVVFPQTVSKGATLLRLMLNYTDDTQALFTMPLESTTAFALAMGKQTKLEVVFDPRFRLRLTSATVLDWVVGSTIDDDVEDTTPSLYWATGNLVADGVNGCRIGAPTDGGLFFRWGKLVGWSGGKSGDGTDVLEPGGDGKPSSPALSARVTPVGYTGGTSWSAAASITGSYGPANAITGVGDPCRYYLGVKWRTPTKEEFATLTGTTSGNWVPWATSGVKGKWGDSDDNGGWFGDGLSSTGTIDPTKHRFFPATGVRSGGSAVASLGGVGTYGCYWSSSSSAPSDPPRSLLALVISAGDGVISQEKRSHLSNGYPVRCVNGL